MLFALTLALQNTAKIELLCSATPFQNVVRYRLSIDEAEQTFTGTANETVPIAGKAVVTTDAIMLTKRDERVTYTYQISRVTGDLVLQMGVNDKAPARSVPGSCQEFTGRAF